MASALIIIGWLLFVIAVMKLRKRVTRKIIMHNIWCHICLKVTKHDEGKCTEHE
jgi:hypothetical protein